MDKEKTIRGGYFIVSRNIIESKIWRKPPLYLKVWLYLIASAQYTSYKELQRGQLYTSIPKIQEICAHYVGFRKVTPSKDQIFNILEWLRCPNGKKENNDESDTEIGMITTVKATHGMLINVENYDFYQDSKNYVSNRDSNNIETTVATMSPNNINKKHNQKSNNEIYYINPENKQNKNKFHNFIQSSENRSGDALEDFAEKKREKKIKEVTERKIKSN